MNRNSVFMIVALLVLVGLCAINLFYAIQLQTNLDDLNREIQYTNDLQDMIIKYANLTDQLEEYQAKAELIKAAAAEGKLTFYFTPTALEGMMYIDAFRERYPFIEVEFYRSPGASLLDKWETEMSAGLYVPDVFWGSEGNMAYSADKGYFEEYVSPESVNFPDWTLDQTKCYQLMRGGFEFIMVNNEVVPEELWPQDWTDFINPRPEWTGLTAINDGRYTEFGYLPVYTLYTHLGESTTQQIYEGIAATNPKLYTSMGTGAGMCVSGERPICTIMSLFSYATLTREGAPLTMIIPTSGVPVYSHGIAICKNASNPNAARLFYDFFISDVGAQIEVLNLFIPYRNGFEPDPSVPSLEDVTPLLIDIREEVAARAELMAKWEQWMGLS